MNLTEALSAFTRLELKDASRNLLAALGYNSDKFLPGLASTPEAFEETFTRGSSFDKGKALFAEWKSADLIFQYTEDELSLNKELLPNREVSKSLFKSYVFISIELKQETYARGAFSAIARQVNRVFPMPVMVLFKHSKRVTIAVINRRRNKLDEGKDVLEKATLIRDINTIQPHRGHVDILTSLALPNLKHPQKKNITDFDALHAAWEQILNVELLNQRFYRDLSNWYFWALKQVEFPADLEEEDEKRKATGLIRLLTRLIFCWFLKEKDLIPDALFNQSDISKLLKDFDPESEKSSKYYQAILQNLFFATLNQRMGKDGSGKPYRGFAADEGFLKNRQTYDINSLYRHESHFAVPQEQVLEAFEDIPFLNGGLFECLDRVDESTGKKIYIDGFSRNSKKRPHIPDRLFFDAGETADLSGAYGDTKRKAERVEGLVNILQRYKFTIVENTPIDQEIALDPELLGKVFENLLASYNEETKTTARKQTGSFYTPRPIVDYMVDESLKSHLKMALIKGVGLKECDAEAGLDLLFAYTEKDHAFSPQEVKALIGAIDSTKILDPACGSGAFPMGALHKLVYILGKLDPNNDCWKQAQLAKIDSAPMREELERAFSDNNDDYGRKLYLIESCLFGVDIQPIAIQITKLRFFISLVCDQKTNRSKKDNHGIRPLPNLETKFVAADTLNGLPISEKDLFIDSLIAPIENEIEAAYHAHFTIQRRDQKVALQKKIKSLRIKLTDTLASSLGATNSAKAKHLSQWDPFDPQISADFFDPHWMFGRSLKNGFDIVIGNPPYQSAIEHKKTHGEPYRDKIKDQYASTTGTWDLYIPFFEAGLNFLRKNGVLAFITPNKYLSSSYGIGLRQYLINNSCICSLTDISHLEIFEAASVYPVISVIRNTSPADIYDFELCLPITKSSEFEKGAYQTVAQSSESLTALTENLWGFLLSPNLKILKAILVRTKTLDEVSRVCATTTAAEAEELGRTLKPFPQRGWKTLNTGTIDPFSNHWESKPIRHQKNAVEKPVLPEGPGITRNRRDLYSTPKILVAKMALQFEGYVDRVGEFAALNSNCISCPKDGWTLDSLAVILHSSVVSFVYKQYFDGLRMSGGYLPFQAPQLKTIPIPHANGEFINNLDTLGRLRSVLAKDISVHAVSSFISDLCDACAMECYFPEYMSERNLRIHQLIKPHLDTFDSATSENEQRTFASNLCTELNEPNHPISKCLNSLPSISPDFLGVIKREAIL